MAAAGGVAAPVTTLGSDDAFHSWPELLPGGTGLLFTVRPHSGDIGTPRIAVKSLETGEQRVLMEGSMPRYLRSGHVVFARQSAVWAAPFDRNRLAVTGDAVRVLEGVATDSAGLATKFTVVDHGSLVYLPQVTETRQLVWVSREGREERLGMTPRAYVTPRLSPDGRRVVVDTLEPHGDLFVYNLETGVEEQFTFHPAIDQWPLWSPDGSKIYFTSIRGGEPGQIYVQRADGTGDAERVIADHTSSTASGWSADGKILVIGGSFAGTGVDVLTVQPDVDPAPKELLATAANEAVAVMSPNGRWLAYRSDESGQTRIYVRPFPDVNSTQRLVSDGPGSDPLWGPDGRELFYFSPDGVMAVAVEAGDTFQRATPRRLFSLDRYFQGANINWDISRDGQRFLMVKRGTTTDMRQQIIVVQNWLEELKRLVPTDR